MDWPTFVYCAPPILTPFHAEMTGYIIMSQQMNNAISTAWTANNKAYYYPFHLDTHETAYQLLFWVGGTSSGNIDVGIYDSQLNRIVSMGTTAMSATVDTWQVNNITDTALPPGDYLLGVACSTTGGFGTRAGVADEISLAALPVYEQTTALPLPDPAVPVACTDGTVPRWGCGIQFFPTF